MLGLRLEHTDLTTLLTNTNEKNDQDYVNFFPSAHTSYKFTESVSMQAGYSKRIFRPRLWDLNPFANITTVAMRQPKINLHFRTFPAVFSIAKNNVIETPQSSALSPRAHCTSLIVFHLAEISMTF